MNAMAVATTPAAEFPLGKLRARIWTLVGFLFLVACNGIAAPPGADGIIPCKLPDPGPTASEEGKGQFQLSLNRFGEARSGCFFPIDQWGEEARL